MASDNITIRIDPDTKKDFGLLCQELGISISMAFNLMAKQAVRDRQLPVNLSLNASRRFGALKGLYEVPDDFDFCNDEIYDLFEDLK